MKKKDIEVLTYAGMMDVSILNNEEKNSCFPPYFGQRDKAANKLFYAMLKTDDKIAKAVEDKNIDTHEGVSPHVIDMLMALNELQFPIYGQRDVSTREGNAREIANDVLPYAIASGNNLDGDRKAALDIGKRIIEYYVFQEHFILCGASEGPCYLCNISDNLSRLIGRGEVIRKLFDAVRENAKRTINDVNYMNMIGTYKYDAYDGGGKKYGEDTINGVLPEVSLIYTCSLIGDENITKELFDLNLDELKKYTKAVRYRFLGSSSGSAKMENQPAGKHFKH